MALGRPLKYPRFDDYMCFFSPCGGPGGRERVVRKVDSELLEGFQFGEAGGGRVYRLRINYLFFFVWLMVG